MENLKQSLQLKQSKIDRPKKLDQRFPMYVEMIPHALQFLLESFEINASPAITTNPMLTSSLTKLTQSIEEDQHGNLKAHYTIELSKRLLEYYTFKEQLEVLKYELIMYAYSVMGMRVNKIQFDAQVKALGLTPIDEIELRGVVYVYECCNADHERIEMNVLKKLTNDDSVCPVCKGDMRFMGEKMVGDKI